MTCPVCSSNNTHVFLAQRHVPVHQNMVFKTCRDARDIPRGDLDMSVCHNCGFVFNAAFDEGKVSYDEHYDNTQCHSGHFLEHMDKMAGKALKDICKQSMTIVEVGCGKGDFLKKLVADTASYDSRGYGFDPTYVGPDRVMDGRVQFEKTFYGPDCTAIDADLVVSRHVIEHIKKPRYILNDVASGLENAGNARICFETPDVTWIFKNKVIWDFFYEHCSLFTPYSLSLAFDRCGLDAGEVETVFGDQYLWITSHKEQVSKTPAPPDMAAYLAMVEAFESHYDHYLNDLAAFVQKQKKHGPVALWGAGAKGMTLLNLIDPDCDLVDCVIDINPNKQGGFIAGTGHEIIGIDQIPARGLNSAVVMNPNYMDEIAGTLQKQNTDIKLLTW